MVNLKNIPTDAQYYDTKSLQLKHLHFDMFRPFLVSHPQGVCISIFIKRRI
jgi:hypothetical protein